MKQSHILYLTDSYLAFSDLSNEGFLVRFQCHLNDVDCVDKFKQFLNAEVEHKIKVVIDVLGEEIKQESIPHVSHKDRDLLLARKAKALFSESELLWKKHVKREKKGRKDDVFLMVGVQLSPPVKNILDCLIESELRVEGVFSMPILGREVVDILPNSNQFLVISRVLDDDKTKRSYRQSFYKDNELMLSRVVRVTTVANQDDFEQLVDEIERMQHFLMGARYLDHNQPLEVITALKESEASRLMTHKTQSNIEFKYANLNQLAEKKGLVGFSELTSFSELLGYLILEKNLKPHFKPSKLCESFERATNKRRIDLTSIAVVVATIMISAALWLSTMDMKSKSTNMLANIAQLTAEKTDVESVISTSELSPTLIKQVVDLEAVISTNSQQIDKALGAISNAMQGYPDVAINAVQLEGMVLPNGQIDTENPVSFYEGSRRDKQVLLNIGFSRQLTDRVILNRLDSFMRHLQQQAKIKAVTRVEGAIDTSSSAEISERLGNSLNTIEHVDFSLRITL